MSDLIDRQAVIDLLKQMRKDGDMVPWEGKNVFARIRMLPALHLEERTGERAETHACDLISRQAAIDGKISIQCANGVEIYSDEAVPVEYLKALPSAQSELIAQDAYVRGFEQGRTQGMIDAKLQQKRKTGYWTLYDKRFPWTQDYKCSQCGKSLLFSCLRYEAKFCPNCGAKMEGILNG